MATTGNTRRMAGARWSKRYELPIVSTALVVMFLQLFLGSAQMGLAYDELFHIPAGVAMLDTGVRRSTLDHPPLGHFLAGLTLRALEPSYDRAQYFSTDFSRDGFTFGRAFFNANARQIGQVLLTARLPFMALSLVGALYCYLLSRSFWGRPAGLFSLVLYSFCPALLAWNRLVYLDGLLASVTMAAIAHLCWFLRTRQPGQLAALTLYSVAVLASKYSGVFIVPLVVMTLLLPPDWFGEAPIPIRRRLLEVLAWSVGTTLLLWGVFGFAPDPLFYLRGAQRIYSTAPHNYRFYLFGKFKTGWWYYYLVQWLVKSTLPTVLLTLGAVTLVIIGLVRRDYANTRKRYWPMLLLVGTAFGFLALTSWKSLAIGARYLLPMYPPLYAAAGVLVQEALRAKHKALAWGPSLLLAWHGIASLLSFPDQMGYFNELVGGSKRGIFVANDASLDAGQNLPRLARYLRSRGNPVVKLYYQGTDDPSRYGISYQLVTQAEWDSATVPGLYAISSYPLVYGQIAARENPKHRDWLNQRMPVAIIGNSIWIYEIH